MVQGKGDFLIDTVNPRLKSYNKPLSLAIAIGGFTVLATLLLFFSMVLQCDGNRTLVIGDIEDVDIAFNEGSVGTCYYYAQVLRLESGFLTNTKCVWTNNDAANLCDWVIDQTAELEPCYEDYSQNDEAVIQVMYKECPPVLPTLGAAFGYATFIELFFTGVIIFPLLKFGCIKNGRDSSQALSVMEWVKDMYSQKDTGQEVIGHAGVPDLP
jgi:hypothetical protein